MDKVDSFHKAEVRDCTNNLNIIYKKIMEKKNVDEVLDYLLNKDVHLHIQKYMNRLELLDRDKMMSENISYCNLIVDFTQPRMRKIHSILKLYGHVIKKFIKINKGLNITCHKDDSNDLSLSVFNYISDIFCSQKCELCPICPACDDMFFKVLYRNICLFSGIIFIISFMILLILFKIEIKYKY